MTEPSNVLPDTLLPILLSGQYQQMVQSGLEYDFLVGGVPFRVHPEEDMPYLRDLQEDQKEQFDNSSEAGEQSFGYWWLRSQASFHAGAGQLYLDSATDPDIGRLRFESSTHAYPWSPGKVTIAGTLGLSALSRKRVEQVTWSGVQKLATMSGVDHRVYVADLPALGGSTTIALGATGTCQDMTSDGANLYVAVNDRVYKIDTAGVAAQICSAVTFSGTVTLGYAKQRLILTIANKVYVVDTAGTSGTAPVLHYTHPSANWNYTCVAEGPVAIYLVGAAGPKSEVQSIAVTESGGTVTLGAPLVQLKMPTGETARAIMFYTNSLFVLASSNGIRAGMFTPYGQPQYGALMAQGYPTTSIAASGSLVYVGGVNRVFWVDLGTPVDGAGRYAWATYSDNVNPADATDVVLDLTVYQAGGQDLVFGALNTGNVITQATYAPTTPAVLTTSWMRYGTVEPKRAAYIRVEGNFPVVPGVTNPLLVEVETDTGETASFPAEGGQSAYEFGLFGLGPAQAFRVRFTLRDGGSGNDVHLRSWQIKALPVPQRYRELVLPLDCYDRETDKRGRQHGYDGFCADRLAELETLAESNPVVTVFDKLRDQSFQAIIRRCQFRQVHSPTVKDRVGGKINLILKLV
ncbi:hypothetical protein [Lentzea sp. NBRC 102530]|uniref:hypothetical protein n=1 Tax=Lentzea sp. NBRC 102530 TaxID=3032201 RepID=UPI0024A3F495|nr:hypothetical protein [Lentzea sp. NBRC 102530]GLY55334.1 hypothetical protein Lesp01_89890 [Lentzea sp. NBRC 102530]